MPEITEANPQQEKVAKQKDAPANMSMSHEDLARIVAQAVAIATSQSAEVSAKILADALLESRKPYVDPRKEQNDKMMKEQTRQTTDRINADIARSREYCPHKKAASELSTRVSEDGAFVVHVLDTGEMIGICTNCQKVISSLIPEDLKFFSARGGNTPSRAGTRIFADPLKVMRARLGAAS